MEIMPLEYGLVRIVLNDILTNPLDGIKIDSKYIEWRLKNIFSLEIWVENNDDICIVNMRIKGEIYSVKLDNI